ncbi:uncharacterized protein LOC131641477 [Vicia villosa]|uniref:uncharacterized protein LOC131641477 n=1 Tax=Vicia villosa TaxID=3911 RepID=UPI00273B2E47|nr:uncharacterized protein LOC131641477 [Vicia villosa]
MGDYFERRMDYDIDLNIPLVSQNSTQNLMNIRAAYKEVHQTTATTNVSTLVTKQGSIARSVSHNIHVEPMFFIDSLLVIANHGVPRDPGRRRYRRHGQPRKACPTDPLRFCTNLHCMTRKTPMWRSGPIGPRTLCNACGIYYNKHMIHGNIPAIIIHEDGSSSVFVPPTKYLKRYSSTS